MDGLGRRDSSIKSESSINIQVDIHDWGWRNAFINQENLRLPRPISTNYGLELNQDTSLLWKIHSHSLSLMYCLQALLCYSDRVESL